MNKLSLILFFCLSFLSASCVQDDPCSGPKSSSSSESLSSSEGCDTGNTPPSFEGDSEAIGYYSSGKLINSEDILSRSGNIHKIFLQRKRSFATEELIDLIINISNEMDSKYSNIEKLQVGDLSNKKGGSAKPNHSSHQNGLDVDIVYLSNSKKLQGQKNGYWTQFFVKNGKITSDFNTSRNWEMFKYIVDEGRVNRILVDPVIKKEMCKHASSIGEKTKYKEVLRRLRPVSPHHETHFHLRLKCPSDDKDCRDQTPPSSSSGC